jgi:hypothetical protein
MPGLILKWNERHGNVVHRWFIRGIDENGTYYGELTRITGECGRICNLEGTLTAHDVREVRHLAEEIRRIESKSFASADVTNCTGLLAEGPVARSTILFRYRSDAHPQSESSAKFLRLIDVLRPYIAQVDIESPS